MTSKVGIKDIAEMAGVSASTVSKVLRNYPNISPKTRDKVMAVISSTGFIPNAVASALSSKKNNRIALFVFINDKFQQIDEINMLYIQGAFDSARKENLELVTVFNDSIDKLTCEETARYFHSIFADTIIVFGINKNDEKIHYLAENELFKMVVVDACIEGNGISTVMVDHKKGQYEVADRVCDFGDTVLYIKGKDDGYITDMRLEGMKKLAEEKKLKLDIVSGDFSETAAYDIVKKLTKKYDAIVCASDLMAIGARMALPEGTDIKISGFDGIRLMGYVADDVITCRQDFYRIGSEALMAAERLRQGGQGEKVILPYEITRITR